MGSNNGALGNNWHAQAGDLKWNKIYMKTLWLWLIEAVSCRVFWDRIFVAMAFTFTLESGVSIPMRNSLQGAQPKQAVKATFLDGL